MIEENEIRLVYYQISDWSRDSCIDNSCTKVAPYDKELWPSIIGGVAIAMMKLKLRSGLLPGLPTLRIMR